MIPILNLLSPQQKKEMALAKTLLIVHEMLLLIFIVVTVGSSILLGARLMLEQKFRATMLEQAPGSAKITKMNREVTQINLRLSALNRVSSSFSPWTAFITNLLKATPDGVEWKALQVNSEDRGLILTGFAPTRDALLKLRDNLSQLPYLSELNLPLHYLIDNNNIDFVLDAKINIEDLKTPPTES